MTWHFQLIKREDLYSIHERYPTLETKECPLMITERPVDIAEYENIGDIKWALYQMAQDIDKYGLVDYPEEDCNDDL